MPAVPGFFFFFKLLITSPIILHNIKQVRVRKSVFNTFTIEITAKAGLERRLKVP